MLITGLNKNRDFWDTINDSIEAGTGTTQETGQDTDLETPVAGTEFTADTSTKVDQAMLFNAAILGVGADSSALTEFIWKNASPEKAGSRVTLQGALTWLSTSDIKVDTEYFFYGRNP